MYFISRQNTSGPVALQPLTSKTKRFRQEFEPNIEVSAVLRPKPFLFYLYVFITFSYYFSIFFVRILYESWRYLHFLDTLRAFNTETLMSPSSLLVCVAIILGSAVFGIAPQLKTTGLPQATLVANDIVVDEPMLPVITPFHPRPVKLGAASDYTPPEFALFTDSSARKKAFYAYMLPKIYTANAEITFERQWLLNMSARRQEAQSRAANAINDDEGVTLDKRVLGENEELAALAKMEWRYRLKPKKRASLESRLKQLLLRVDVVPASLVLAQAAKESGWGTSRFAREGNNFFGIWCFYKSCGMTPERRDDGRFHEVAMFDTVEEGVRYYIRTINSHIAYDGLRETRAIARQQNEPFAGEELASGLLRYSERGLMYVNEIQSMIRYNQLQRFTRQWRA